MSYERAVEMGIADTCQLIWQESPRNHVCGLLEEAVEVAHASKAISKRECLEKLVAIVDRVYDKPFGQLVFSDTDLHGELVDVTVMTSVVRESLAPKAFTEESLVLGAFNKIRRLNYKFKNNSDYFKDKLQEKRKAGIRFQG